MLIHIGLGWINPGSFLVCRSVHTSYLTFNYNFYINRPIYTESRVYLGYISAILSDNLFCVKVIHPEYLGDLPESLCIVVMDMSKTIFGIKGTKYPLFNHRHIRFY